MRLLQQLMYMLRLRSNDADLIDEIALHREMLQDEFVRLADPAVRVPRVLHYQAGALHRHQLGTGA